MIILGGGPIAIEKAQAFCRLGTKVSVIQRCRDACRAINNEYNPYDVVGSGLNEDVLVAGRIELQKTVQDLMYLFGSTNKA